MPLMKIPQFILVIVIVGCGLIAATSAQDPEEAKPAVPTAAEVQKKLDDLEKATDMAEEARSALQKLYREALSELEAAVKEMTRVSRDKAYICIESFRNEQEKANLLYWQLTCRSFYDVEEWEWLLTQHGYTGDIGFIYFE